MSRVINLFIQTRSYSSRGIPKIWRSEGVRYGDVTYYPRSPNHQDPPITPTKLLMVQRVKPYKGQPYWDKDTLDSLKLNEKLSDIAIVKNSPDNCSRLWKIKHLIKVTPINLPDELPDENSGSTWLHENGTLLTGPRVDPVREKLAEDQNANPKKLDSDTLRTELRMRWSNPYDT